VFRKQDLDWRRDHWLQAMKQAGRQYYSAVEPVDNYEQIILERVMEYFKKKASFCAVLKVCH
jgi:glycine/serine hydroxymethyltransferase